jgi:hypothetical protein
MLSAAALKKTGLDDTIAAALLHALGDPAADVRSKALEGIATDPQRVSANLDVLSALAKNDPDRGVRATADAIIDRIPRPSTVATELTEGVLADAVATGTSIAGDRQMLERFLTPYVVGNTKVFTPFLLVANAAADAKSKYLPFTVATIPKDLLLPVFAVDRPGLPPNIKLGFSAMSFKHVIVANGPGADATISQPTRIEPTSQEWKNGFGNVVAQTTGVRAYFPLSLLKEGNELRLVPDVGHELVVRFSLVGSTDEKGIQILNLSRIR